MNRLWFRLALGFVIFTWLIITVVAILMSYTVETSFGDFLNASNSLRFGPNFIDELLEYYENNQSWDGVSTLIGSQQGSGSGGGDRQGSGGQGQGAQIFIAEPEGSILYATNSEWTDQNLTDIGASRTVDLVIDGELVGLLGEQTPGTIALNTAEQEFLQKTSTGLILIAFVGGVIAFIIGSLISLSLTRPLNRLARAVGQLKSSDLGKTSVPVEGTLEISQLGTAFNDLSARVGSEIQQRKRMTADIAHELRTPVTVMRGHVEAMMDGIYPLDVAHIAVAYDQILHLTRLIEDMRLLTRAEAGQLELHKTQCDVNDLIQRAVQRFEPLADDAQITLTTELPVKTIAITVDVNRIQQALDNLITNALRHTPEHGTIILSVTDKMPDNLTIRIYNTGDPIPAESLEHLFDRFWRADDARERDAGGTGLGLAITKLLITLHDGDIVALPAKDGAMFEIRLPL